MLLLKFKKFIHYQLPLSNVIKTTTTTTSSLNYHLNQYCYNTKYELNGINTNNNNNNNNNTTNGSEMIIQTSMTNVKRILKSSEIPFEDGFTAIKTYCPICCTNDQIIVNEKRKIFINKITGNVICPGCQHVGNWTGMYEKFFQQTTKTSTKKQSSNKELDKLKEHFLTTKTMMSTKQKLNRIPDNLMLCQHLKLEEFKEILKTLNLSNFPETIFYDLNVLYDAIHQHLYFPLFNIHMEIVGYRILKYNLQQTVFEEETIPDRKCFGLIMYKNKSISSGVGATNQPISQSNTIPPIKSSSEKTSRNNAIIVLTILDLLALTVQPKINYTIICLPHGYKSLPQECLPGIESYQKLILWFNYDGVGDSVAAAAGWDTAKMFAKKFDEKRCLFVRPTEQHPTPYEAYQRNSDIKGILTKAQPILHKSITTFQALRQDVLSDLQNIDKVQGVKWTRYPQLNKLLKGHRKGELTVLTGPTGCGKTTFMSEYSLDLTLQGVTTLWGSFEIRNTRLASTLLRQMAGCPLDENLQQFNYWADQFEHLPMYFMTFHGQQTIKIVMEAIEHAQYVHDIQHVIIDNVQFMMGTSDESKHLDRFWKQDAIISAFRTFATKKNCHVTLVIHPRKERDSEDLTTSSIFGSAKATQEADNVLIIQDKRLTSVRGKKYLQVAKNRYCGDLGIMPLDFDKYSLSYAQTKKIKKDEPPMNSNKSSGETDGIDGGKF